MDKASSKDSNELLEQFILNMDKAISKKLISDKKDPNFLSREERWELISIKYIKDVGAMIETASEKFDFLNEELSKKYIDDAIKICNSYITMVSYGQAESMSSIILQAADKRIMMPNAHFMCHYGSSANAGNYLDTQNWAKFEKKIGTDNLNK